MTVSQVIVPDRVRHAINLAIDAALADCPEAAPEREDFYHQLLVHFDEHGVVPDFKIVPRVPKLTLEIGAPEP